MNVQGKRYYTPQQQQSSNEKSKKENRIFHTLNVMSSAVRMTRAKRSIGMTAHYQTIKQKCRE